MFTKQLPLCLMSLSLLPIPTKAQGNLDHYRDKNRLVLVFAPNAVDSRWQRQDKLLARSRADFAERELLRFDLFERGAEAARLRERYKIKVGSFRVLLIGKDGHVAFERPTPVSLRDLTDRIDRMPMRQDEMRRRREEKSRQKENP
jgi:6-phosphogluconolactonase/glucosamine-6-phosphate isomerase/deaminase